LSQHVAGPIIGAAESTAIALLPIDNARDRRLAAPRPARADTGLQISLAALRKVEWVVYAKRPFGGPDAVLASTRHWHSWSVPS
jgi:hypothetical protein